MAAPNDSHRVITVETDIQISDYRAFTKFIVRRALVTEAGWRRRFLLPLALGLAIAAIPSLFAWIFNDPIVWLATLVTIVSTWASIVVYSRIRRRELLPQPNGMILGPRTVSIDAHAIRVASEHFQSLFALDCVQHIGLTAEHVFVVVDRVAAIIVPRRDFHSPAECDQFVAALMSPRATPDAVKIAP